MATVSTYYSSLDMTNLDFYRVTQGSYASSLSTNVTVNGVFYPSVGRVYWQNNGYYYASIFAGSGIQLDANNNIIAGTVNGYVESAWNGSDWLPLWGVADFSTSASALYQAFLTPSTADDFATIRSVLSGNDVFFTGAGNDILAGYGGNDFITVVPALISPCTAVCVRSTNLTGFQMARFRSPICETVHRMERIRCPTLSFSNSQTEHSLR